MTKLLVKKLFVLRNYAFIILYYYIIRHLSKKKKIIIMLFLIIHSILKIYNAYIVRLHRFNYVWILIFIIQKFEIIS